MPRAGPKKLQRYSLDCKRTGVRLSQLPDIEVQAVANALDIHPFMLSRWRKEARDGVLRGLDGRRVPPKTPAREVRRLQELERAHRLLQEEHALVAHESSAATGENRGPPGEACQVLPAPAGRRASAAAAVRRHAAEDLGAASAGRLTRGTGNAARLAKKWHKCGAVSEKCLENRASSRPHVTTGRADGL